MKFILILTLSLIYLVYAQEESLLDFFNCLERYCHDADEKLFAAVFLDLEAKCPNCSNIVLDQNYVIESAECFVKYKCEDFSGFLHEVQQLPEYKEYNDCYMQFCKKF